MKHTFILTILLLTSSNLFSTSINNLVTRVQNENYTTKLENTRNANIQSRAYRVDVRELKRILNSNTNAVNRQNTLIKKKRENLLGFNSFKAQEVGSNL